MIRILITIISSMLAALAQAQAPGWAWGRSAGSSGTDNAFGIAAHSSGSSYVTGQFGGSGITFGSTS
jgi:hypothetical protein